MTDYNLNTPLCGCGCGQHVARPDSRFKRGHNNRKSPHPIVVNANGCWVWQWAKGSGKSNYGCVSRNGRPRMAHVVYWEEKNGPVPDGLQLDHLCRNTLCVNPDHLEPVTSAVNTRRGLKAKLTESLVREIRAAVGTHSELASRYGVAKSTIWSVKSGDTWGDVL